jgi:hypothetical protein
MERKKNPLPPLNNQALEMDVPNRARRILEELNQSDGWTDGKDWDQLDETDQNELLCQACEIYNLDWDEYCRNYQISNTRRRRDLSPAELRERAS